MFCLAKLAFKKGTREMNSKQVADELENIYWIQGDGKGKPFQQYADFVRQQQAEYYSLLVNHDKLYAKVVEQQAEIESLKAGKIRAYDNGYEDGRKPNTNKAQEK